MSEIKEYLVYAGPREDDNGAIIYMYYRMPSLMDKGDLSKFKKCHFKRLLFKSGSIGSIYEVTFIGTEVQFNPNMVPKTFWSVDADRIEWTAHRIALDKQKELKAGYLENILIRALTPVRKAYKGSNSIQRRALLSEIIRIITS